jgi:tRNA(adenine34) deaminase
MKTDEEYMRMALKEAEKAAKADEVPVGAIIVRNGEVIAKAHNLKYYDFHTLVCHSWII